MFGNKLFAGVGYPTPASIPDTTSCFTLNIPASDAWWSVVVGLLYTLIFEHEWQQLEGGLSREEVSARWQSMLEDALEVAATTNTCGTISDIEAPYWEGADGGDADVQLPPDAESWFGVLNGANFVDDLAGWVFTGFVAASFGVDAAVEFATSLSRLRLLLRTGDTGAIVRVFLDHVAIKDVDTYSASPGIISVDLFPTGTTISIQNTGTANEAATPDGDGHYSMEIVKKRLTEDEVYSASLRVVSGVVQRTPDGGDHWNDSPNDDPRHNTAGVLPPNTAGAPQCDAAATMTAAIKSYIDGACASATAEQIAYSILSLIVIFIPGVDLLWLFLLAVADALITIGTATITAAFTTSVYNALTCILKCAIATNGSVSAEQFAAIQVQVTAHFGAGTVNTVLQYVLSTLGEVGLNNAGVVNRITGNCSACTSCPWVVEYDFSLGMLGWYVVMAGNVPRGQYIQGLGFYSTLQGGINAASIRLDFGYNVNISKVEKLIHGSHGTGSGSGSRFFKEVSGVQTQIGSTQGTINSDTPAWQSQSVTETAMSGVAEDTYCDTNGSGNIAHTKVRLTGSGTLPPGGTVVS